MSLAYVCIPEWGMFLLKDTWWLVEAKAVSVSPFLFLLSRYWGSRKQELVFQSRLVLDIKKKKERKKEWEQKKRNKMWESPNYWARTGINQCSCVAHSKIRDVMLIYTSWESGIHLICERKWMIELKTTKLVLYNISLVLNATPVKQKMTLPF